MFVGWCSKKKQIDPLSCSIESLLSFLQELLKMGRSPSTLKVYVAALSSHPVQSDGPSLGSHRLVVAFLKGTQSPHFAFPS